MSKAARKECLKLLNRMLEPAAVNEFLKTRQADLGEKFGQELLDSDAAGLLARLKQLEVQREANG